MKRLLNIAKGLLGLLALAMLAIVLALAFRELQTNVKQTSQIFQSPITTPTLPPYPLPVTSTPPPTPRPTSTRPPEPPTRTPTPTFAPAPPTPTPEPLPTLIPGLQTFLYATTKDGKPALYRFQAGSEARKASAVVQVDTRAWPTSRTRIEGLYPSPDGKHVAVAWVYGEGGTFISILDVNTGRLAPLFGEEAKIDQRVFFLDWSPDGSSILVLGRDTNSDLRGRAWLVNISTHQFRETTIKETTAAQQITEAAFSPDGKTIVYARSECYECSSEVWRVDSAGFDQKLLFKVPQLMVGHLMWSPNGRYIAFTQWRISEEQEFFIGGIFSSVAVGELWVMDTQQDERHKLSSVLTGYYGQFGLTWSPDSKQIAFVASDEAQIGKRLDELHSNVYVVDSDSNNVKPLTRFSRTQILAPTWSPDGSMLAFAGSPDGTPGQLELWVMKADGSALQRVDENRGLTVNADATNVTIVWLP